MIDARPTDRETERHEVPELVSKTTQPTERLHLSTNESNKINQPTEKKTQKFKVAPDEQPIQFQSVKTPSIIKPTNSSTAATGANVANVATQNVSRLRPTLPQFGLDSRQ